MSNVSSSGCYQATRKSLASHQVPQWYDDAKLGIFIHWSVASVPGFAPRTFAEEMLGGDLECSASPYSEWYWNSLKFKDSPVAKHHRERYGDREYESFAEDYRRGLKQWKPDEWAETFRAAGARYVVLVTKHHDGFLLWPSEVAHPNPKWRDWHAGRDLVGELATEVRQTGMRFGTYYSGGLDWTFDDRPLRTLIDIGVGMPGGEYPAFAAAQVRELIERYAPDVLWNDISWPEPKEGLWELIAHYYNALPEGVINDRWLHRTLLVPLLRTPPFKQIAEAMMRIWLRRQGGMGTPPVPTVFDVQTPEYQVLSEIAATKWESVRGMDGSFGFNRNSKPEDFLTPDELIHSLVDIVSKNGNLLLNVGPRGEDAQIPEVQLERLRWLGSWLDVNGEAIYETRPWTRAEGRTQEGIPVRFTKGREALYAILLGTPPTNTVTLLDVPELQAEGVRQLGSGEPGAVRRGSDLEIEVSQGWADQPAHAFALQVESGGCFPPVLS